MINTDNHHYAVLIISLLILFIIASACICVNIIIKVLQLQNTQLLIIYMGICT